jgi:hypothetical protein
MSGHTDETQDPALSGLPLHTVRVTSPPLIAAPETQGVRRLTAARVVLRVAVMAGALVAAVFGWSAPRSDVPLPGPEAKADEVVLAYITALHERDFDTANAIDSRAGSDLGRFSRPMRMTDVSDVKVTGNAVKAHVVFKADFARTDMSMSGGRQWWGYVLRRDDDHRWVIVDSGVA